MDWEKASAELRKKLNPAHVKPPAKFGPKGSYIEGWLAIDEANRIFGFGEWSYEVRAVNCVAERDRPIGQERKPGFGVTYTAHVRVMVGSVVREDFGAGHGYDVDLGLAHESAIKEAVTDSLKRALRTFGNPFGLALYDKSRENVGVDEPEPAPPPKPPARDPKAVADALVAKVAGARTKAELDAALGSAKFDAAWEWLHVNAMPESERVKAAVDAARARLDPVILGDHNLEGVM